MYVEAQRSISPWRVSTQNSPTAPQRHPSFQAAPHIASRAGAREHWRPILPPLACVHTCAARCSHSAKRIVCMTEERLHRRLSVVFLVLGVSVPLLLPIQAASRTAGARFANADPPPTGKHTRHSGNPDRLLGVGCTPLDQPETIAGISEL